MKPCKVSDFEMTEFRYPKPDPDGIKTFIKNYGDKMKPHQIKLLKLMAKNIYGFHLERHDVECTNDRFREWLYKGSGHKCVFTFEMESVKGEITIYI